MSARPLGLWAGRIAIAFVALSSLLWVRALAEARLELQRAARAAQAGDGPARRQALSRAVRWTAPLNPYADEALEQLLEVAHAQERRGDRGAALRTYRAARGSLVASAGLVQLESDTVRTLEAHLARLGSPLPPEGSRAMRHAAHRVPGPRLLALGGFVLWVAATFALARLGTRPARRSRLLCGALLAVGLCSFGVGLWWS